jgi:hypothetical protein
MRGNAQYVYIIPRHININHPRALGSVDDRYDIRVLLLDFFDYFGDRQDFAAYV